MLCKLFFLLLFALPAAGWGSAHWVLNADFALEEARARQQPLLLVFVGAGWCPWSTKLEREVLSTEAFANRIAGHCVLGRVVFAQHADSMADQQLRERFQVHELPTLLLLDAEGKEIVKMGYLPLSAEEFGVHLKGILGDYHALKQRLEGAASLELREVRELFARARAIGCKRYRDLLFEVGLRLDPTPFFLLEKYELLLQGGNFSKKELKGMRKEIMERDPKNHQGALFRLALLEFQRKAADPTKRETPKKVLKPLYNYLKEHGSRDRERVWQVQMKIAEFFYSRNQLAKAVKHALLSERAAPPPLQEEIAKAAAYLQAQLANQ